MLPQVGDLTFWVLGYPARALEESLAAVRLAEELAQAESIALSHAWACLFRDLRREAAAVQEHAQALLAMGTQQGARAYWKTGRPEEGLRVIQEALAEARTAGLLVWEPELLRLEGELRLATSPADRKGALECFHHAIAIARRQQARSWELRAASSLARLLAAEGHRDEARRALAGIYSWFTEGSDTADLREAKILLEDVS